jgi:hypothetical protein
MGTELPTKVMLGQTLVLMQMTFLNNVRKVGKLVLSRTSCYLNYIVIVYRLNTICGKISGSNGGEYEDSVFWDVAPCSLGKFTDI